MKILAIDSSSTPASVAVTDGIKPIGEFTININRTHSEKLLPLTDSLLDAVGLKLNDIDAFAISVGPGSFTGLRIGMSSAKLMAQTLSKPLIGVKTLEAMAENVSVFDGYVVPVLDARNNTVYTAIYEASCGMLREVANEDAVLVSELAKKISLLDKKVLITGEYQKYKSLILSEISDKKDICFAPPHLSSQRAVAVAVTASRLIDAGVMTSPDEVNPLYVRESQAEREKKSREQKL